MALAECNHPHACSTSAALVHDDLWQLLLDDSDGVFVLSDFHPSAGIYSVTTRRRWSARDRMEVLNAYKGKCAECGQPIQRDQGFDLDHVIPLRAGGDDKKNSLRPLCRGCHRIKTAQDQSQIGKTRRQEQKSWGVKSQKGPKLQGRPFNQSGLSSLHRDFPKTDSQSGSLRGHEALAREAKGRGKEPLKRRPLYERIP